MQVVCETFLDSAFTLTLMHKLFSIYPLLRNHLSCLRYGPLCPGRLSLEGILFSLSGTMACVTAAAVVLSSMTAPYSGHGPLGPPACASLSLAYASGFQSALVSPFCQRSIQPGSSGSCKKSS